MEKALAIQVDDPISFMQLLAKSDSGISEVRMCCVGCLIYTINWDNQAN